MKMKAKTKKSLKKRFKITSSGNLSHQLVHSNHRKLSLSRKKTIRNKKNYILSSSKVTRKIKAII